MGFLKRLANDRRGSVAVTFSLAATPLMLMTGAAMDYSRASRERHNMQAALDSALLAAALAKPAQREGVATNVYKADSSPQARIGETLTFSANEVARTFSGEVRAKVPTMLMKLGGYDSVEIAVKGSV